MLCKRLYKKASFIAILVMIPLSVAALSLALQEDSGFVKIALAATDSADPVASKVIEGFMKEETMVVFACAETPEEAIESVKNSDVDAAWIFSEDMSGKISEYIRTKSRKEAAIRVVVKEQNVFTRITQEKLSAALFEYCAREEFVAFVREQVPELKNVSREELCECFNNISISEDLFEIKNSGGADETAEVGYLSSPLRGLLALLVLLASFAGALFYMQDEKRGAFAKVPEERRIHLAALSVLVSTINVSAVTLATLYIAGLGRGLLAETVNLLVYAASCSAFALLLKELLASIRLFAAAVPILMLAMTAVCPIFLGIPAAAHMFIPTYYINGTQNSAYVVHTLVYGAICFALAVIINFIKRRFPRKGFLANFRI
jgi:hypothetical protein